MRVERKSKIIVILLGICILCEAYLPFNMIYLFFRSHLDDSVYIFHIISYLDSYTMLSLPQLPHGYQKYFEQSYCQSIIFEEMGFDVLLTANIIGVFCKIDATFLIDDIKLVARIFSKTDATLLTLYVV